MAQLELKNISISLSGKEILKNVSLKINDNEKVALVGRNGCGKTTLLRFLIGEVEMDYNDDNSLGEYIKDKKAEFGVLNQIVSDSNLTAYKFLEQAFNKVIDLKNQIDSLSKKLEASFDEKVTIRLNQLTEEYTNLGGHYYEKEINKAFCKFGFDLSEINKKLSEFSGGQVTKLSLLRLVLSKPEILLLDEPTNHLDIDAIEWLEEYLSKYEKNIIIVSHDRMFIDNTCDVIVDIDNKNLVRYEGNYSSFVEQKKINYELELAKYNKNLKEIERLSAIADRFRYKATKAKMVKSKDKIIERLQENNYKPTKENTKNFNFDIKPLKQGGKEVLRCDDLTFGYKNNEREKILGKIDLILYRGDRLAIIGKNGTGKSTLLKTLVGKLDKLSGNYRYGYDIEYEYFDQNVAENQSEKTVMEYYRDTYPMLSNEEAWNRLGSFLFTGDEVNKIVKNLSGGEKVRLTFALLFEKRPNLLILDEPTNHLDILGKESLEDILNNYKGTVIFVSHDRYFIKKVATRVLYFDDDEIKFFDYGYADYDRYIKKKNGEEVINEAVYRVKKENQKLIKEYNEAKFANNYKKLISQMALDEEIENEKEEERELTKEELYELQKQKQKNEKLAKKIEEKITNLEKEIEQLNIEYTKEEYQTDFNKLCEINLSIEEKNKEIENLMNQWEELCK